MKQAGVGSLVSQVTAEGVSKEKKKAALLMLIGLMHYDPKGMVQEVEDEGLDDSCGPFLAELSLTTVAVFRNDSRVIL